MPVNPAYRDFFAALDAIEAGAEQWGAYQRRYLARHREVLRAYWSQCWSADEERMREIVREIRPDDYRPLRQALEHSDVDGIAREALRRCAALLDLPAPQVDLLVGRFSPDAFLFQVEGQWHIGIGLERFAHFAGLPAFIAHEYGHYARRTLAAEPVTLGDAIVAEGAAVAFSQAAYPERALARHLRMSPRRVHEIREREASLWAALKPLLGERDPGMLSAVLHSGRGWQGFPPRFGGCLGYWAVRHFADARAEPVTSRAVLAAESEAILAEYLASAGPQN